MKILGLLLMITPLLLVIIGGGNFFLFISLEPVLIVGIGSCGFLLLTQPKTSWPLFFRSLTLSQHELSEEESIALQRFCDSGSRSAISLGIISHLIGMVNMLATLSDPSAIGPAMAVSLLSILYALAISELIFSPVANRCPNPKMPKKVPAYVVGGFLVSLLTAIITTVLLVSFN